MVEGHRVCFYTQLGMPRKPLTQLPARRTETGLLIVTHAKSGCLARPGRSHPPVIPALRRLRQGVLRFEGSLGFMVKPSLQTKKKRKHVKGDCFE